MLLQEELDEGIPNDFFWSRCSPDQMMVFSAEDLPVLFDVIITHARPSCSRQQRVVPANVLFLCGRFAHYFGNRELVADVFIGAFTRILDAVKVSDAGLRPPM